MNKNFNAEETVNKIRQEIKAKGYEVDELSFIPDYHRRVVDLVIKNGQAVIFGCGNFGRSIADDLEKSGVEVSGFCDNNENNAGSIIDGRQVMKPKEAYQKYPGACFVVTPKGYENEILRQLVNIGVSVDNIILFNALLAGLAD